LFYHCSSMAKLVEEVLAKTPTARHGPCEWQAFEDGFPNLMLDVSNLPGRHVVFFADLYDPKDLFPQISVMFALPKYFCKSLTVLLPYFPTGTMERVDTEGQIATAHTLARIFSTIPLSREGPARIVIFDIHTLQNRFYFSDTVIPYLTSALSEFKRALNTYHANEEIVIAFPDEGAQKRFKNDIADFPQVVCSKVREGDKRIVTVKEGDCNGKHVVIIDDLVRTGGTLIECKKALEVKGASKVSCFVTHAVFPPSEDGEPTWKRFTRDLNPETFHRFFVTNSCPTVTTHLTMEPFVVLSLAESISGLLSFEPQ